MRAQLVVERWMLVVLVALPFQFGVALFVTILTELSKHDLGELVGGGRGQAEEDEEKLRAQ